MKVWAVRVNWKDTETLSSVFCWKGGTTEDHLALVSFWFCLFSCCFRVGRKEGFPGTSQEDKCWSTVGNNSYGKTCKGEEEGERMKGEKEMKERGCQKGPRFLNLLHIRIPWGSWKTDDGSPLLPFHCYGMRPWHWDFKNPPHDSNLQHSLGSLIMLLQSCQWEETARNVFCSPTGHGKQHWEVLHMAQWRGS